MAGSRKIAATSAGTAFLVAAVVAGVTAGLNGVSPEGPGEIAQLVLLLLLTSAAAASLVYCGVVLATKNRAGASERPRP
ncbi:hypothetical protein KVA01_08980 [Kocuria varians]|uniref:Uncharacterized protein n=1 Tax=Kocuria varians TaxID=1272 RepID=A0A4Y4D5B5_KOCVA|nr:hypothetical protein [Kocuria varians]GEC98743.1 hypothetical protein KVA01_08980 [Kocuria varians]